MEADSVLGCEDDTDPTIQDKQADRQRRYGYGTYVRTYGGSVISSMGGQIHVVRGKADERTPRLSSLPVEDHALGAGAGATAEAPPWATVVEGTVVNND
jgi:hypothetical protein